MIVRITGKILKTQDATVILDVNGIGYEIAVPPPVLERLDAQAIDGYVTLMTYHYWQISPSSGTPILVGFLNDVERDFFQQFIKVSGIGPRAAVKALNRPISEISQAIDSGDLKLLQTLPGIGRQKAKEIVAKLQGKVGKYGLLQDRTTVPASSMDDTVVPLAEWQDEALAVLEQLQYRPTEARDMVDKALQRNPDITTAEDLLNEIYKQRILA